LSGLPRQVLLYLFDEDKVTFFASGNLVGSLSTDNDVYRFGSEADLVA